MDLGRFRIAQAALTKKTAKRADVLAAALLLSTLKPAEDEQQFTMCETLIEESLLRGIGICFQTYNHDVEILAPLMHTLYCIGSVDRFVTSVVEFGAHVSVIKVLKQHSTYDRLLIDGVTLMGNLAINDHVKALIRMDKGIELIVSIMQQYESSNLSVTSRCCYALSNLAFQSAENVTEMTSENTCLPVVTRVLNSLSDKLSNDVQLFDEETDVFESALCLLSNLATTNDTVRLSIIRNGAGGVLSALATALPHVDSDLSPLSFTLKTLASLALCAHPEGLPVLCRDHHLIGSMCVLLRKHASHVATLDLILSVVANIAVGSEAETLSALIYAGTLPYIDEAGAQHTTNVEIQTNILIVIGNILSRSHVLNNEQRFETERACANCVLNVMTALPSDENIIHHCLRLVMRLVQDERVTRYMCVAGAALRLLSLLQFHEDVEMKQSILRTLSELTNTTTANALLEAKVLKICLDFISNEQSQIGLVLSAMRVLVNLASAPSSSVVMVNEVMPILFTAFAGPFSSSIQLLQMIAACVANLAHHRRCVALLCKTKVPHTLCDLVRMHSQSPEVVHRLALALLNMVLCDPKEVKPVMNKEIDVISLCVELMNEYPEGNAKSVLMQLAHALVAPTELELREERLAEEAARQLLYKEKPWLLLPKSEQLRGRFGIPILEREIRTFVIAGKMMLKVNTHMAPHQRHVFVSPDLRFFVWRAPEGDNKDIKSVFLPHAAGIQPGLAEDNMRRSSVNPDHCFSVFGLLRNVTMEVDSIHERDKWVDSLRAVIRFNEQVQLMKYGQSGEDVGPVELGSDTDIEKRGREKAAMLLAEEEERKYEAQYGASAAGVSIEIV